MKHTKHTRNTKNTKLEDKAVDWLHKSKKQVTDLYEESMKTLHEMEKSAGEYSDEFSRAVRKYPVSSVLIAGGVGALFYLLVKQRKNKNH